MAFSNTFGGQMGGTEGDEKKGMRQTKERLIEPLFVWLESLTITKQDFLAKEGNTMFHRYPS